MRTILTALADRRRKKRADAEHQRRLDALGASLPDAYERYLFSTLERSKPAATRSAFEQASEELAENRRRSSNRRKAIARRLNQLADRLTKSRAQELRRARAAISMASIAITMLASASMVTGAAAASECPNGNLRTNPGVSNTDPATGQPYDATLPDCRAYEQVSPTEKEGGSGGVFTFDSPEQDGQAGRGGHPLHALPTGSSITYGGEPFYQIAPDEDEQVGVSGTPGERYAFEQQYTSVRSASGWNTEHGDDFNSEEVPPDTLQASVAPNPTHVEESPSGAEIFYIEAGGLYEYRRSPDDGLPNPTKLTPIGAGVQGLLGNGGEGGEEGSYVYFVASGVLAPGAVTGTCEPETLGHGKTKGTGCKLYMYHDGVITFIATLSPNDEQGGTLGSTAEDWSAPSERTSEVSPNGRYVAFDSNNELNRESTPQGVKEFPKGPEIFRYSAESGELTCVSCGPPTPIEPDGPPLPGGALNLVSTLEAPNGADRQRYMLNDGRVLFDTPNALVPQDTNGQPDVYEWDPVGVGSCATSSDQFRVLSNGCVALISGGTSDVSESTLADASPDGSNVFFTTSQSLVPQDQDEITDLYDAREGGGFFPPPPPTCPTGAHCPNGGSTPPALPAPSTLTNSALEPPGPSSVVTVVKPKPLSKAQKLAKALRACRKAKKKSKRKACEAAAHERYGPKKSAKKTTTKRRAK
jgi:hypothetical protein